MEGERSSRIRWYSFADRTGDFPTKSLFQTPESLLAPENSLFLRVGNLAKKPNETQWLQRHIGAENAQNRENSLYFPWITANWTLENSSLMTTLSASALWKLALRIRIRAKNSVEKGDTSSNELWTAAAARTLAYGRETRTPLA